MLVLYRRLTPEQRVQFMNKHAQAYFDALNLLSAGDKSGPWLRDYIIRPYLQSLPPKRAQTPVVVEFGPGDNWLLTDLRHQNPGLIGVGVDLAPMGVVPDDQRHGYLDNTDSSTSKSLEKIRQYLRSQKHVADASADMVVMNKSLMGNPNEIRQQMVNAAELLRSDGYLVVQDLFSSYTEKGWEKFKSAIEALGFSFVSKNRPGEGRYFTYIFKRTAANVPEKLPDADLFHRN
jgi:hypothetical protein